MELTGSALEAFESWYFDNYGNTIYMSGFHAMPNPMKYGVCVDWFDSVGIYFHISCLWLGVGRYDVYFNEGSSYSIICRVDSRSEARITAISKANELYNNQHD